MNHTRSAYFFDELSERLQETNKNAKIKIEDRIEHTIVDLRWSVRVISLRRRDRKRTNPHRISEEIF